MAQGIKVRGLRFKCRKEAEQVFARIGSTRAGNKIMASKVLPLAVEVSGISHIAANILKQEALARGGDVVTSKESLLKKEGLTQVIIIGTDSMLASLARKIKIQPFGLKELARHLDDFLGGPRLKPRLVLGSQQFDLEHGYAIMGILNVTPDSFYDGGRYLQVQQALPRAEQMIAQGADIIDVGGMSTRPGSNPVSLKQELERTIPVIKAIKARFPHPVSIDTYRSEIARAAVEAGADIINDISALSFDKGMAAVAADSGVSVILMHIKGTPADMQLNPTYQDVVEEIYWYLYSAARRAVSSGIGPSRIIVDPGIGFGKTAQHNLQIIKGLDQLGQLGYPVLVGVSRKSFIEKVTGLNVEQRLLPSLAAAAYSYINGARLFRVHDVEETRHMLDMVQAIRAVS